MNDLSSQEQAVELLQQLGLKEYEAKCFVALSRIDSGTAKDISNLSEVPRTRVYDAVRVLETKGLVESHHSNPQRFRAVSLAEATDTLRAEYESRVAELEDVLAELPKATNHEEEGVSHEVWALSGTDAISNRVLQLVEDADDEILFVTGSGDVLSGELFEQLKAASADGVDIIVGASDPSLQGAVESELPAAQVFVSGLEWLTADLKRAGGTTEISRLLLVDQSTILVSVRETESDDEERAVFGSGFTNGFVVIMRRLMATGLLPENGRLTET